MKENETHPVWSLHSAQRTAYLVGLSDASGFLDSARGWLLNDHLSTNVVAVRCSICSVVGKLRGKIERRLVGGLLLEQTDQDHETFSF